MKQTNRLGFTMKLSRFAYLSPPEWQIPTSLQPKSLIRFWTDFIGLLSCLFTVGSMAYRTTSRTNGKQDANKRMKD